jgi:hypothetical protein
MTSVHLKPIDKLIETMNFRHDITQKDLKTHICKLYQHLIHIRAIQGQV